MNIKLFSALFLCLFFSTASIAQKVEKMPPKETFDPELAKKLGADDYGMKNYVFCILKTGPNDSSVKGPDRDKAFAGHMSNMSVLAKEGKLAVAGPFGANERAYRGIFILNVATIDEAKKLVETDPAVKAGIFLYELTPWYGSASLMATPEIHKKIAKTNP